MRKVFLHGTAALLVGITFGAILWGLGGVPTHIGQEYTPTQPGTALPETPEQTQQGPVASELMIFSSYEELKDFVNTSWRVHRGPSYYWENITDFSVNVIPFSRSPSSFTYAEGAVQTVPDYSTTNIQVAGVDEADIVKTDGEYLYVVSGGSVFIVKAYPAEDAEVLSRIELNGTFQGMFISGDKLIILDGGRAYWYEALGPYVYPYLYIYPQHSETSIRVYDVLNRSSPVLVRNISLDGDYFNSRMIGDYVYAVINRPVYWLEDEVPLPQIHSRNLTEEVPATQVCYLNVSDSYYTFTTIIAVNVQNDTENPAYKTLMLPTGGMYVSRSNIYITYYEAGKTLIYRIHIEGGEIECVSKGEVTGRVLNQFSMDEYGDYFRVATTTGYLARTSEQATSKNHLYVLDMNLTIVGSLEDLAPGEKIYSARFMGDRCYLVTFRKVDPLFVIDLGDPENPAVLGWLKVTGYSDYLHPYDENHVIGIGKETVASEWGDFSWYQGVKISLFDVSNVSDPKEIDKYVIGDRGTDSPVLSDHKAFLFDKTRNLLVIPVLVAEIDEEKYPNGALPYTHGDYVWQGAYVFHISLDGLVLRSGITHIEDDADLTNRDYYVKRSLYIDDVLYTVSDKKIKMNHLEDLREVNEVELP